MWFLVVVYILYGQVRMQVVPAPDEATCTNALPLVASKLPPSSAVSCVYLKSDV